jgi:hypothetical protein
VHLLAVCPFKMLVFTLMLRGQNSVGIWQGIKDWRQGRFGWLPNPAPPQARAP